ncbi:putative heat-labile enterotoxin [Ophiocordyceps polyrhachis-furcata BCC 54312]|uniref:Heat-labile enterotoxin n=1 Tax=Ophiocordyceps polyrhachis-furcata BCC 54312 TaxID=1330021 RepID=A0A367L1V3_9HYPO|nr:putative heat-labile enterotoxin [Ophiocordyceps polyrhachis-furcata BCC 54312]
MRCQHLLHLSLLTTFGSAYKPPRTVYRADRIHPMDLELQGGFIPRGMDGSGHNRLSLDFSLYNHVLGTGTGSSKSNSAFVATSKTERAARRMLSLTSNGVGFIYTIHVTSNFYDVEGTLGFYYMHTTEQEVAALGRVQFSQVVGWTEFRQGVEQPFVKNQKYDHKLFDTEEWAGTEYRIAGFPDNHVAWKQEPWKSARESGPSLDLPCSSPPTSRKRQMMKCDFLLQPQPKPEARALLGWEWEVDAEAEKLFAEFASKFGLMTRAAVSWHMTLPELRERFRRSSHRVSSLKSHRVRWWSRGMAAVNAAVSGQSIFEVAASGTKMMSVLDRASIIMSILPGIGCSFQAWADEAHGKVDPSDIMLCVAADLLMVNGLGLPLIALMSLRSIRTKYLDSKMPTPAEMRQLRDKGWESYQESMMNFLKSPDFIAMSRNHFMAEMAGVMFEAAEALSRLRLMKREALSKPRRSFEEKRETRAAFDQSESALRSNLSAQAWERHDRLKSELPLIIKTSLRRQASEFNEIFIGKFEDDVEDNRYEPWANWGLTTVDLEMHAQAMVWHLRRSLPATPELGEIQHRVHEALTYLETPSLCTEYRPNGAIVFHCGDPSDGDNYGRGRVRSGDEAVYRPPKYQSGCNDTRERKGHHHLSSLHSVEQSPPPCTERRGDGGVNFNCGGPSDGESYRANDATMRPLVDGRHACGKIRGPPPPNVIRWIDIEPPPSVEHNWLQLYFTASLKKTTMGMLRFLVMGNHFAIFISSLIVTGILSYFIHRSSYRDTHIIFQEVIAVITFVLWLFGMLLPLVDRYKGHLMPVNLVLSYLWLTAFIFAAQDWSGDRCYDGPPMLENCGKKHTAEAFMFLTFFFLICNTVSEAMLWRSIPRDADFSKTGTARGVDNSATARV